MYVLSPFTVEANKQYPKLKNEEMITEACSLETQS